MSRQLTANDAKESLTSHVADKGIDLLMKFGPRIGWKELQAILRDKAFVRYPCKIVFDLDGLQSGEVACAVPSGFHPEDGYTIFLHPLLAGNLMEATHFALYQLVVVNYGEFASAEDAETFGAAALGLTRDEYYSSLCTAADRINGLEP